ncbi:hypothetical protein OPU39_05190, partial [Acinetobacter nosocomialis]|nr:hypothetical protein [Acinetobacter nosocomialis]
RILYLWMFIICKQVLKDAKHGFSNPLADERAKANGVDLGYNSEAEKQGLAKMYALLERTLK